MKLTVVYVATRSYMKYLLSLLFNNYHLPPLQSPLVLTLLLTMVLSPTHPLPTWLGPRPATPAVLVSDEMVVMS